VILTGTGAGGLEVYLVRRSPLSRFMAGTYVFPGGVLDPLDRQAETWARLSDLGPEAIDERLGGGFTWEEALAHGVAAIRETFEEAGAFLGAADRQDELRAANEQRRTGRLPSDWLLRKASDQGWRLALSCLARWAWWITPAGMARRYSTRYFIAAPPFAQACSPDGREVVDGLWISPQDALLRNLDGSLPLSPPTLVTLHELLPYRNPASLLTEARSRPWGSAVTPRLISWSGGALILEPWDPDHSRADFSPEVGSLGEGLASVGEPFSRLWYDGRLWRPVRSG
jgi:8-oxo-dGTP pyrophosphatase MutT (NUDIX family)